MDHAFWHARWARGEIGFHQSETNPHLVRFWSALGLPAGTEVFVPLCGKSLDLLWLAHQGHAVLGVELHRPAVAAFFAENGLAAEVRPHGAFEAWHCGSLRILCGDVFALAPAELAGVRGVYDRAALIALPPALRATYVAHLGAVLPPAAATLLVTLEYPEGEREGPPFSVPETEVRTLYEPRHAVEPLASVDLLASEPERYAGRGITRIADRVYALRPRAAV